MGAQDRDERGRKIFNRYAQLACHKRDPLSLESNP